MRKKTIETIETIAGVGEYIPMYIGWDSKEANRMFENGILPDVGDEIKIICYDSGDNDGRSFAKCVFRAVKV